MSRTPPPVPPTEEPKIGIGHLPDENGQPYMVAIRIDDTQIAVTPDVADQIAEMLAAQSDLCRKPKIVLSS
jgi:hypothetical protein